MFHMLIHSNIASTPRLSFPREGLLKTPTSEEELSSAIIKYSRRVCGDLQKRITDLEKVLHEEPHRDIRWPNVMRHLEDRLELFIIDWEDAALAPALAEPHFERSTHSPRIFVEGHGTEPDIWGVGGLVVHCDAFISSQLTDMGRWMQGSSAPSAREALDKIKEYISSQSSMHAILPSSCLGSSYSSESFEASGNLSFFCL